MNRFVRVRPWAVLLGLGFWLIATGNAFADSAPPQVTIPAQILPAIDRSFGFDFTAGMSFDVPHTTVRSGGTGTFGGVERNFNSTQFTPTFGFHASYPITPSGLRLGLDGSARFPTSGTIYRDAFAGPFDGAFGFRQGFAGTGFATIGAPALAGWQYLNGVPHTPDALTSPFIYLGAGFEINSYSASAVFPGAHDFFRVNLTEAVPAFKLGTRFSFADNGTSVSLFVEDFLPGGKTTMPGGNFVSFATAKAGNTVGVGLQIVVPVNLLVPNY